MPFKPFRIGRVTCKPGRPLIAGILNVTPDSFSDGGKSFTKRSALEKALRLKREGAEIIDIGGESSRPGSKPVSLKEETRRVIPVIEAIRKKSSLPISIDTTKPEVAIRAVDAGADMINDIYGFTDPAMVKAAVRCRKPVVVMHMKGTPQTMQKNPRYKNVTQEVARFLKRRCEFLHKNGVKKIIIDPGIGFGKNLGHNLALLRNIGKLAELGYPVMIGASRKSFIEKITGAETDDRLGGSLAAHIYALMQGATLLRVHDVAAHRQALDVYLSIKGKR